MTSNIRGRERQNVNSLSIFDKIAPICIFMVEISALNA